MSDLTEIQSSQSIKIAGAASSGVETNYVNADINGNLQVVDYATSATGGAIPVDASYIAGKNDSGNLTGILVDVNGKQVINLNDGSGNAITSSPNGVGSNQLLHIQTPDTATSSTALGALNAIVKIAMAGLTSVGFQLSAGTLIGTIQAQASLDGGTTWTNVPFYNPTNSSVLTSVTFSSSNTLSIYSILPIGGASHIQVIVTAYTSGTANSILRASQVSSAAGAVISAAFGTVNNTYVTLTGNTATLILVANPNRKYAYISNDSGSQMNIQFGATIGLNSTSGLVIPAKTFYELKGDNLYTGNVYGFAAGGITVSVTEGTP